VDEETQNASDRNPKAGVRRDLRAAAIGGLAATFVVAASLAPKLMSNPNEVSVHNSSTESAFVESTTATAPPDTTTTEAPTTTTIAPPIEQRVTVIEHKVQAIEATTTTQSMSKDYCGRPYNDVPAWIAGLTDATWTTSFDGKEATFTLTSQDPTKTSYAESAWFDVTYTYDGSTPIVEHKQIGNRVCDATPVVMTWTAPGTITNIEIVKTDHIAA
jgi:hypothetical protein